MVRNRFEYYQSNFLSKQKLNYRDKCSHKDWLKIFESNEASRILSDFVDFEREEPIWFLHSTFNVKCNFVQYNDLEAF